MSKKEDFEYVRYRMSEEGFHYCFNDFSEFNEIDDKKFHKLRIAYLKAAQELEDYINENAEGDED